MRRLEKKLLVSGMIVGAALTCAVVAIDAAGLLEPLENWLYDARARTCQLFAPKPTDKLVHLDIDDRAVEAVGRFPWPRARWAEILDELKLAGPKAVEMDVVFSEPQEPTHVDLPGGKSEKVNHDALFASAVARSGNVILPMSLVPDPPPTRAFAAMVEALKANPELDEREVAAELKSRHIEIGETQLAERLLPARRE